MSHSAASDTIVEEIDISAPADQVFTALASAKERVKWWGAAGRFRTMHVESDLRPGGKWLMRGIGFGGKPFTIEGVYQEIDRRSTDRGCSCSRGCQVGRMSAVETLVRFDFVEKAGVTSGRLT
ncbi:MAG: SRPBCC family protein, partial [Steroidobacteraceae bacterium]